MKAKAESKKLKKAPKPQSPSKTQYVKKKGKAEKPKNTRTKKAPTPHRPKGGIEKMSGGYR